MLRIHQQEEKYEYVIEVRQQWLVRFLGFLGVLSALALAIGYILFLKVNVAIFLFFLLPMTIIVLYFGLGSFLQMFFNGFDISQHASKVKEYWRKTKKLPSVAVFIPASGEDIEIVAETARAAKNIDYKNKKVYILDDTKEGFYYSIAKREGVEHINRPDTGVGKKSGNLNYAFRHTPMTDHVLVLDADFIPRKEILKEMLPYADVDCIGIVQSPQHFKTDDGVYERSKIEYAAGEMPKDFYRVIQPSRNRFGGAICVGTNALYNRHALKDVGGYSEVEYSEDVNTGLKIINYTEGGEQKYSIRYIPLQLATGICPQTYYSFYKQQSRWCTGSFKLVLSKKTLFSKVLSPMQKVTYFSNCLYYLYTLSIVILPLQFLALNLTDTTRYKWQYSLLFVPQIVLMLLILPYAYRRRISPLATAIATTSNAYTFMQAMFLVIIRRPLGWEATGVNNTATHKRYAHHKFLSATYFLIFIVGTFCIALLNEGFGLAHSILLQLLFVYALVSQTIHFWYMYMHDYAGSRRVAYSMVTSAAVLVLVAIGVVLGQDKRYDVVASTQRVLAIRPESVTTQNVAGVSSQAPQVQTNDLKDRAAVTDIPSEQREIKDYSYTVAAGQTMSALVADALNQTNSNGALRLDQLGYMHDYLLIKYGYALLDEGQQFVVKQADIQEAKSGYDNAANSSAFWEAYGVSAGLKTERRR